MTEIIVNDPKYRLWVAMRLGLGAGAFPNICGSVGHERDGEIMAATIFTGYDTFPETGRSICWGSIAAIPGTNWCTRRYVKAMLAVPFDLLGVYVLRTMCSRDNTMARKFNEKLGLHRTGIARKGWDGQKDAVHYDLLPAEAAKWLGYEPDAWKDNSTLEKQRKSA